MTTASATARDLDGGADVLKLAHAQSVDDWVGHVLEIRQHVHIVDDERIV